MMTIFQNDQQQRCRVRVLFAGIVLCQLLTGCKVATLQEPEFSPVGAAPNTSQTLPTEPMPLEPISADAVAALMGQESALLSTLRLGLDGAADSDFARALGVDGLPGKRLAGGGYAPSSSELTLNSLLQSSAGYSELVALLNPYEEGDPKASAYFIVDYAQTTTKAVEYLPGNIRQSHYFQMGMSFVLLDAEGKEIFRHATDKTRTVICLLSEEQGTFCNDVLQKAFNQRVDKSKTWRFILHDLFKESLQSAYQELGGWAQLLSDVSHQVSIKVSGTKLNITQSAADMRSSDTTGVRYLFLEVPGLFGGKQLKKDLIERGKQLTPKGFSLIERQLVSAYRNGVDQGLRELLNQSRQTRQAGIFLLPDIRSQFFRDGFARALAGAMNNKELLTVLTDEGERVELPDRLQYFGKVCLSPEVVELGSRCMSLRPLYSGGETYLLSTINSVPLVAQAVVAASVLYDPIALLKGCKERNCYYPHSMEPDARVAVAELESQSYHRIENKVAAENDDEVYLRDAANRAFYLLGENAAVNIVKTFDDELSFDTN